MPEGAEREGRYFPPRSPSLAEVSRRRGELDASKGEVEAALEYAEALDEGKVDMAAFGLKVEEIPDK